MISRTVDVPSSPARLCAPGIAVGVVVLTPVAGALSGRIQWGSVAVHGAFGVGFLVWAAVLSRTPAIILTENGICDHHGEQLAAWSELAELVRSYTDAPIRTGTEADLRRLQNNFISPP